MPGNETTEQAFNIAGKLWDDNPASIDLLGINTVVATVQKALADRGLDPVTIGIHSPWGGGKTTTLDLLGEALKATPNYVVIRTNPWEYDDHDDVRGLIIAEVVQSLEQTFHDTAGIPAKAKDLLKRISWSRVTALTAKGIITSQWNPAEIVKTLTPQPRTKPTSMNGFRDAFEEFLAMLPDVDRVIVLVDDLDRCLPDASMATLEAIKLFLSVEKMSFVLACDERMVRDAISASLHATGRAERFADNYLDKIVQLPVSLPRLNPIQAGTYVAFLFAGREAPTEADFEAFLTHCNQRRQQGLQPVIGDLSSLAWRPADAVLSLAQRIADGLSISIANNPRYIKRFLNALSVRSQIADENGISIDTQVIAKLYLLEDRYPKSFEFLVSTAQSARGQLLTDWESWATGQGADRPEFIDEATKEWAQAEPSLSTENLDRYFALAASFHKVTLGGLIDDSQMEVAQKLANPSQVVRTAAYEEFQATQTASQSSIIQALISIGRNQDANDNLFKSLVEIASEFTVHGDEIVEGIRQELWNKITAVNVAEMQAANTTVFDGILADIAADESLDGTVRRAAQERG